MGRSTHRAPAACLMALIGLAGCATDPQPGSDGRLGLGLADTALAGGAPGLALQVSDAVLAQQPHDLDALLRQGDAYYQLGDGARASASYRQALQVRPQTLEAVLGLGRVALATDPAQAAVRFEQVLTIDPINQAACSNLGVAADLQGHHAEAQADYRRAIALGGDTTATEVDLAVSLALSGDPAAAIRILQPIAAAPDATARVRQDLALALVLDDRTEEAAPILLTQMSPAQARAAIDGYRGLKEQPTAPGGVGGSDVH